MNVNVKFIKAYYKKTVWIVVTCFDPNSAVVITDQVENTQNVYSRTKTYRVVDDTILKWSLGAYCHMFETQGNIS